MSAKKNLETVINSGLCNQCGTCVGLSEGKISFQSKEDKYLPQIPKNLPNELAKRIWQGCPAKTVNFPDMNKFVFGKKAWRDQYLGHYKSLYIAYATDKKIRRQGSSGGIITALLLHLINTNQVDGAVVLGFDKKKPWLSKPYIATTKKEILKAAGSKYTISSTNEILKNIENFKGRLAFVGIPPHIHSIRKLQMVKDPSVKNIKFLFGPFYGNTLNFSSIISLLKSYKVKDYRQIKSLKFREGDWPGYTKITLKSGRVIKLSKFYANYLIPFHITKRSLLCTDFTNEFTDISGGDAWTPKYEQRHGGFSLIISRSIKGDRILRKMELEGLIKLKIISKVEVLKMHSHGYDLKKRGAFIRIKFLKFFKRSTPDYGYVIKGFSFARYIMEVFIDLIFLFSSTRIVRKAVESINPLSMGKLFSKLRDLWKLTTKHIKKTPLQYS